MTRKNGRVIGALNETNGMQASGVFDLNDISAMETIQRPSLEISNNRTNVRWVDGDADPYYDKVFLQYTGLDANNWILKDYSASNWHEMLGQTAYNKTPMPSHFGPRYTDWCTAFHEDGYITVTDTTGLQFGANAFTIEFWIKLQRQDATQNYVMGRGNAAATTAGTGWTVLINTSYQLAFYDAVGNLTTTGSTVLNRDQWYHVAIVRSSTAANGLVIYIDGAAVGTGTCAATFSDSSSLYIGRDRVATAGTFFGGRITDIRIKNSAVYSAAFTRPSAALDMTGSLYSLSVTSYNHQVVPAVQPQTKTVTINNSTWRDIDSPYLANTAAIITGHGATSIYNVTDNGWLKMYDAKPSVTNMRFGLNAFTVEAWVYITNQGGGTYGGIIGKGTGNVGIAGTGWNFWINNTTIAWSDVGTTLTSSTVGDMRGGWHHIAAVREGTGTNQFKMYIDGALVYTGTVATNYSGTEETRLFSTRTSDYYLWGYCSMLRVSNNARYTAAFTSSQSILDTVGTVDANTALLTCTCGTQELRAHHLHYLNTGKARNIASWRSQNEVRYGQHHPTTRTGSGSFYCVGNNNEKLIANTANSDWNFGTGDFSIEFWIKNKWGGGFGGSADMKVILDGRSNFNDTGLAITHNWTSRSFCVITANRPILTDDTVQFQRHMWNHVVVQRTAGNMALYMNGRKVQEAAYANSIANQAKLYIFNGSYPNIHYNSSQSGTWMSDLRILKGSSAYGVYTATGNTNPDAIRVPTSPLTAISNTTLLTLNKPILWDYSGRGNMVTWPRADYGTGGGWDIYASTETPYQGVEYDRTALIHGVVHDNYCGHSGYGVVHDSSIQQDTSFITRMSGPWTIEMFVYWHNSNPSAPTAYGEYAYTATSAGHEGFDIRMGYGSGAASYNNVSFAFYTAHNSAVQWLVTSDTSNTTIQSHSWNHIAIQYDPTKTNKMALFVNGFRKTTAAAFSAGQKVYNTYKLSQANAGQGGLRISKTARYDNDQATYTIPTRNYLLDGNTVFQSTIDSPFMERAMNSGIFHYGVMPSTEVKKFGNGSIKFTNKESTFVDRMYCTNYYWAVRAMDIEQADVTFEMWACYMDAAAGGRAINASGSILMHWTNYLQIRVNSSGYWVCAQCDGTTDRQTITTTVLAATKTGGTMDHLVVQRKGGNFQFFVNGIQRGEFFGNSPGTVTAGGFTGTDYYSPNFYSIDNFHIGCNYDQTQATAWCGYIQDFRATRIARYDTKVINGVATMVHRGTTAPALPTSLYPTK